MFVCSTSKTNIWWASALSPVFFSEIGNESNAVGNYWLVICFMTLISVISIFNRLLISFCFWFSFSSSLFIPFIFFHYLHYLHEDLVYVPWKTFSYSSNCTSDIFLRLNLVTFFKSDTIFSSWPNVILSASMLTTDWMKIIPNMSHHIAIECIRENYEWKLFPSYVWQENYCLIKRWTFDYRFL